MKKVITSVVALLVMGSVSFAQDAAKTAPAKKKTASKTETKMDAKAPAKAKTAPAKAKTAPADKK